MENEVILWEVVFFHCIVNKYIDNFLPTRINHRCEKFAYTRLAINYLITLATRCFISPSRLSVTAAAAAAFSAQVRDIPGARRGFRKRRSHRRRRASIVDGDAARTTRRARMPCRARPLSNCQRVISKAIRADGAWERRSLRLGGGGAPMTSPGRRCRRGRQLRGRRQQRGLTDGERRGESPRDRRGICPAGSSLGQENGS